MHFLSCFSIKLKILLHVSSPSYIFRDAHTQRKFHFLWRHCHRQITTWRSWTLKLPITSAGVENKCDWFPLGLWIQNIFGVFSGNLLQVVLLIRSPSPPERLEMITPKCLWLNHKACLSSLVFWGARLMKHLGQQLEYRCQKMSCRHDQLPIRTTTEDFRGFGSLSMINLHLLFPIDSIPMP